MEEQEVLSILRAHVAAAQTDSSTEPGTKDPTDASLMEDFSVEVTSGSIDPGMMDGLSTEVRNASHAVGQLNPRNPGLLNQVIQAFKRMLRRSLGWYTRPLQVFHLHVARAIEQHGQGINSLQSQLLSLPSRLLPLQNQQRYFQKELSSLQSQLLSLQNQVIHLTLHNPFAIALEEASEAAKLATQEQQSPYVRLFEGLSPVVDVGCGRGEFLELLKDAGIESYGVDSDTSACEAVRRKHLTIVEADLFQHLKQLPERSLGGIFSARLIEYLPPHLQVEFVALCSSRLKPGARIVLETINPDSGSPFGRNWRLDPSHLQPIYPEILQSILESNGFHDSQICILAPHVVTSANTGEAGLHSGNGCGSEILAKPGVTHAPAYAAVGTCV